MLYAGAGGDGVEVGEGVFQGLLEAGGVYGRLRGPFVAVAREDGVEGVHAVGSDDLAPGHFPGTTAGEAFVVVEGHDELEAP